MKCETPRQAYIRILQSQAKGPSVLEEKDLIYTAELVRGKYLKGNAPENEDGQSVSVAVTGITLEGRLFLQKLKTDEKAESWIGRLEKSGIFALGVIFGAFVTVLGNLATAVLMAWLVAKP
jgi:hypothetical protein